MGDIDVQAARALCDAATPGPWTVVYEFEEGENVPQSRYANAISGPAVRGVLDSDWLGDDYKELYGHDMSEIAGISDDDAEFIAAARTLVPALLDRLSAAEARTRELEATVQRVRDAVDSAAIYRPDAEAYGDDAWDQIECIDLAVVRRALRGSDV